MLAMGMRLTVGEIVTPLRNVRFILAALGVNFLVLPAAAWLIATLLGLDPDIRIGLILIATVAGAPMIPKLVTIAKGDAASAVALVTLLVVATVVIAPIALPLLLPGVQVDPGRDHDRAVVADALAACGRCVPPRTLSEEAAEYVDEIATISNVALALLLLTSLGQNVPGLLGLFGSGGSLRRCCSSQSRSGRATCSASRPAWSVDYWLSEPPNAT